ncbi:MAG: dimethylargininase [Candidatus Eisenbacteria bacterium]|uniref:Dimethylargininase n=1 Tax=Eiseniibacteriota bacterium TaxID=2212470 RepID=A0A948W8G4_UNCEI|nr:dimethylargininase [Candidatus Eisenbacteria bacterium]MBU2692666.1 dimethylargininase [Candidatus Eisenbacteria bacterium]
MAVKQHRHYEDCLKALGCEVRRLPALDEFPDAVFVEDTAIVLDEMAIMTRPGAASRRGEVASVAAALKPYRNLTVIESPGLLDGGDVLRIGKRIYVGLSMRSNPEAVEQLHNILDPYGYTITSVSMKDCLHLKSAATQIAENKLLINREWVDAKDFEAAGLLDVDMIDVDPAEPFAANALMIGRAVVYPAAFPKTRSRLESQGILIRVVDTSELAKAEGGVTCCSLIFTA